MSTKLFYSTPYETKWTTTIKEVIETKNQIYVLLKETAFYPEGGGQPADTGFIDGIRVVDVQMKDNQIYHLMERKPENKLVSCELDWDRRYDHMQQHTAQHMLSAFLEELYQIPTVSFHLGKEYTTIDIDTADLTKEQMTQLEKSCNSYIMKNLEIKTHITTYEQVSKFPLRKLPKVTGDIRIVEIDNWDFSACAGTHVGRTGELGVFKILKTEKHRGQTRIFFLSGWRAIRDYQTAQSILDNLGTFFKTNKLQLVDRVNKVELEKKALTKELETLKRENIAFLAEQILSTHTEKVIFLSFADKTIKDLSILAKYLLQKQSSSIILLSSEIDKKILIQQNGDYPLHCGKFLKETIQGYEGKGGGSVLQAQGTFSSVLQLNACLKELRQRLDESI
ncbi:alanyl-tRNA editing protein [Niallia circulans]|uniref:alanyl-tRNA editing protein n=1 Tax=Niallia circulans TaxID=1397 RepID=UPI0026EF430A|nr:DHHA1 domain-containing protein [Niallia circulans]